MDEYQVENVDALIQYAKDASDTIKELEDKKTEDGKDKSKDTKDDKNAPRHGEDDGSTNHE